MIKIRLHITFIQILLFAVAMTFQWHLNACTYISDELLQKQREWQAEERYTRLSMLRMNIVIVFHEDLYKTETLKQVTDAFREGYEGILEHSKLSLTETKYYPVHKGKIYKPNLLLAIGLSRRALNNYQDKLREAGLNAHLMPASILTNAKFEYETDETAWVSL